MKRLVWLLVLTVAAAGAACAYDPVTSINSIQVNPRVWNDDPDSIFESTDNFPSYVKFADVKLDGDGADPEYANLHTWYLSNDGGASRFGFGPDSFFELWADVRVLGDSVGNKDHEAGFFFNFGGWDGKMMVKTNGEIAVFGYVLPFHAFLTPYVEGEWVRIGFKYYLDAGDGKRKAQYFAGAEASPVKVFDNTEQGFLPGDTWVGGFGQLQIAPGVTCNCAQAEWANINVVPEPASILVLGAGLAGLMMRRRR